MTNRGSPELCGGRPPTTSDRYDTTSDTIHLITSFGHRDKPSSQNVVVTRRRRCFELKSATIDRINSIFIISFFILYWWLTNKSVIHADDTLWALNYFNIIVAINLLICCQVGIIVINNIELGSV